MLITLRAPQIQRQAHGADGVHGPECRAADDYLCSRLPPLPRRGKLQERCSSPASGGGTVGAVWKDRAQRRVVALAREVAVIRQEVLLHVDDEEGGAQRIELPVIGKVEG